MIQKQMMQEKKHWTSGLPQNQWRYYHAGHCFLTVYMLALGYTTNQIANAIGVSQSRVYQFRERARLMALRTIRK